MVILGLDTVIAFELDIAERPKSRQSYTARPKSVQGCVCSPELPKAGQFRPKSGWSNIDRSKSQQSFVACRPESWNSNTSRPDSEPRYIGKQNFQQYKVRRPNSSHSYVYRPGSEKNDIRRPKSWQTSVCQTNTQLTETCQTKSPLTHVSQTKLQQTDACQMNSQETDICQTNCLETCEYSANFHQSKPSSRLSESEASPRPDCQTEIGKKYTTKTTGRDSLILCASPDIQKNDLQYNMIEIVGIGQLGDRKTSRPKSAADTPRTVETSVDNLKGQKRPKSAFERRKLYYKLLKVRPSSCDYAKAKLKPQTIPVKPESKTKVRTRPKSCPPPSRIAAVLSDKKLTYRKYAPQPSVQGQGQAVARGPVEGDSTGLLGSSVGYVATQPRRTWSMADSQIGIGNPSLGNLNTPRILELDINRMMIGQNTISAQVGTQGLSNDRLVNAANNNLRAYMTVNRPGPSSAGRSDRPLSGSRQSPRPSSSPTNHSSSAKRVRLSDVEIPSMMSSSEPLPPIGAGADRPRSDSSKARQSPPRIPVGNELPESPPGSSLRQSPPGIEDTEITSPVK